MNHITNNNSVDNFKDAFTAMIRYVATHRENFSESKELYLQTEKDIDNHWNILKIYMERRCNKCGCSLDSSQFYDGKGLCNSCAELKT